MKVYVCALDTAKDRAGLASAQFTLKTYSRSHDCKGSNYFHALDLSSVASTRASAKELKSKIEDDVGGKGQGRIDILVCNAGIMFSPQTELSVDGYERTWAVNCLGHFVFVTSLLGKAYLLYRPSPYAQCQLISCKRYHRTHRNGTRRRTNRDDKL